jgi:hypothetical protein
MPLFRAIILAALLLSNTSCKPDRSGPDCNFPAGNRDFTWRADTVALFPSTLGGVWAFADDDAYVMGRLWKVEDGERRFFAGLHWNGSEWSGDIHGTIENDVKHFSNNVTGDRSHLVSVGFYSLSNPKAGLAEFDNRTKKWKGFQYETEGELRSVWTDEKGFFIAGGDNGMVYTKNGYSAEWVFTQAPTDFHFLSITGISKNEVYLLGRRYIDAISYPEIWKFHNANWFKLLDYRDTVGTSITIPDNEFSISELAAYRCAKTDSLQLYVIGWESVLFESHGQNLNFSATNLTQKGLPLRTLGRAGLKVNLFTPNDLWIIGTRYNFYHWNGLDYQKMVIPGLPNDDTQFGFQRRMVKTSSGKIFLLSEVSSQVYVVVQGTP